MRFEGCEKNFLYTYCQHYRSLQKEKIFLDGQLAMTRNKLESAHAVRYDLEKFENNEHINIISWIDDCSDIEKKLESCEKKISEIENEIFGQKADAETPVVWMAFAEMKTAYEISEITGLSVKRVRSILNKFGKNN